MTKRWGILGFAAILAASPGLCDTFTHKTSGQKYHGYAVSAPEEDATTRVQTVEKGEVRLALGEWQVQRNAEGRRPHVGLLTIGSEIDLEMETAAFEKALIEEADKGPQFILIEIDTPGGSVPLVQRLCNAIVQVQNCTTVAYVRGGKHGGAYSGGAAVALACDRIYMSEGTAMGAATMIAASGTVGVAEIEKVVGKTIGEKMRSAWRNYLASLAQRNDRPAVLARAMEDKDIEAVEVEYLGRREFIEAADRKQGHRLVRVWSRKGSLLTLTARDAAACGMAEKVVASRQDVLAAMGCPGATVAANTKTDDARRTYELAMKKLEQVGSALDLHVKRLVVSPNSMPRAQALRMLRDIIQDMQYLVKLKKSFPDMPYDGQEIEEDLNTIQALHDSLKTAR